MYIHIEKNIYTLTPYANAYTFINIYLYMYIGMQYMYIHLYLYIHMHAHLHITSNLKLLYPQLNKILCWLLVMLGLNTIHISPQQIHLQERFLAEGLSSKYFYQEMQSAI